MARDTLSIFDLPNEILVSILTVFTTHRLLQLALVSHRFHDLVLRILHFRLLVAAEAPEYKIILEAYLPSRRYTRPYLFCEYLGTDGLSSKIEGEGSLYRDCHGRVGGRLGKLSGLYSRFRPEYPAEQGKMPARRIAGAAPNLQSNTAATDWYNSAPSSSSGTTSASIPVTGPITDAEPQQAPQTQPIFGNMGDGGSRKVVYTLGLDEGELFGQFCCAASLVKLGPRRGVFLSTVHIVEDKQGVIRVWRDRLLERAKVLLEDELDLATVDLKRTPTNLQPEDIVRDRSVLWTDHRKNVGLRLAVRRTTDDRSHSSDDDEENMPMSFDIEIRELIVRTTRLMQAVEDSQHLANTPGKALIFGSFAVAAQ